LSVVPVISQLQGTRINHYMVSYHITVMSCINHTDLFDIHKIFVWFNLLAFFISNNYFISLKHVNISRLTQFD